MVTFAIWSWLPPVLNLILLLTGLFLILLILIQRGKGGGLSGALGGMGGSSAFGSRAGDTFTRITIVTAAVWILLIMIMIKLVQPPAGIGPLPDNIEQPVPVDNSPVGG
jgi:preprotein translocase subunit SecG